MSAAERGGSKSNVVVMLVLVFFVSLLSFSIGIFVGKKFSDNSYKQAKMEPTSHGENHGEDAVTGGEAHVEEGRHVASVDEAGAKPNEALSDEEIAKLAEEFVTDEEPNANAHGATATNAHGAASAATNTHGANDHAAPATAPAAKHEASNKHESAAPLPAAQKLAAGRTPSNTDAHGAASAATNSHGAAGAATNAHSASATAPAAKIPSNLPAETAKSEAGKYTVQVASYQDEKEAQNLSAQLKSKGYNSFYVQAHVNSQTWFRVCVGPLFTTLKQADDFKKDILSKKVVTSAIIQKIDKQ